MSQAKHLAAQLEDIYEGDPWYGDPIRPKLEAITLEQAVYKPHPAANSIAQILKHMIAWRYFVVRKLKDNDDFDIKMNSQEDWDKDLDLRSEAEWEAMKEQFAGIQEDLLSLLRPKTNHELSERVNRRDYDLHYLVNGILGHDLYHLGQIGYIKSLWDKQS